MSYTKQTWTTGDTVTASKLNHMEDGIAGAGYDAEIMVGYDGEGGYTGTIISGDYATLVGILSNDLIPSIRISMITTSLTGSVSTYGIKDTGADLVYIQWNLLGSPFACEWASTNTLTVYED